jgi:exopolyphosphatase/guanosine-5'-triphosphate,3'-diphosphate pyrophosphatase
MTKRFAAIDIGSSTIKINITDYPGEAQFEKILYKDFPSCLGRNMNHRNMIDPAALPDCFTVLAAIKKILQENKVDEYKYIATHALREAVNQKEILDLIKSNTGIDINVITGEEEAKLTLNAILIDFPFSKNYACINAGGGSTELSFHLSGLPGMDHFYFFRFGAVNLFSDYLQEQSDIETAIKNIGERVRTEFHKLDISIPITIDKVISVGGSIYNAAYIFKKDIKRNFEDLSKMRMSVSDLESVIDKLKSASDGEKKKIPGFDPMRVHTILPGVLIHYFLLKILGKNEIVISTRSISDGLICNMADGRKIY